MQFRLNYQYVALLIAVGIGLSNNTSAGFYNNELTVAEVANALAQCSDDAKHLVEDNAFIHDVSGFHSEGKTSTGLRFHEKKIFFSASRGGFMGRMPRPGGVLVVTHKVTQRPEGMMDAPSLSEYQCGLSREILE